MIRLHRSPSRLERSIVEGPLYGCICRLASPIVLQSFIDGVQGIVDHIMVGRFVGHVGNAAVGASLQVLLFVPIFVTSILSGMSILAARFAGANQERGVAHTVWQSLITAVFLALGVLAPLGYFLAPSLLNLFVATSEVHAEALAYLRIRVVFSVGLVLFFVLSDGLRAVGSVRTPLVFGVATTALNVLLNYLLITGAGPLPALGVRGAAYGTALATMLTSGVFLWMYLSDRLPVRYSLRGVSTPACATLRALLRVGLTVVLQGILRNLGGLLVLYFVGSLDSSIAALAVYTVLYREVFTVLVTWPAVGLRDATLIIVGQNLGAGKPERAQSAARAASITGIGLGSATAVTFLLLPQPLMLTFGMDEQRLLSLGTGLLAYLAVAAIFLPPALVYTGALQGAGDTRGPFRISVVTDLGLPPGICVCLAQFRDLEASDIWLALACGHIAHSVLSVVQFERGRWRRIAMPRVANSDGD